MVRCDWDEQRYQLHLLGMPWSSTEWWVGMRLWLLSKYPSSSHDSGMWTSRCCLFIPLIHFFLSSFRGAGWETVWFRLTDLFVLSSVKVSIDLSACHFLHHSLLQLPCQESQCQVPKLSRSLQTVWTIEEAECTCMFLTKLIQQYEFSRWSARN